MKKIFSIILAIISSFLWSETLFEIKDSSNNKVFDISNDGLRVYNLGDTLMVISATAIRANIGNAKGLSRTFSVTTTSSKGKGLSNALEIGTGYAAMSSDSGRYTNFSPDNIFLGLSAGIAATPGVPYNLSGRNNVFLGNESGMINTEGGGNVFIGVQSGRFNVNGYNNTLIGAGAGYKNTVDNNVFIGNSAGFYSRTGSDNIFLGMGAGSNNDTGNSNVYIGKFAGYGGNNYNSLGTGNDNIIIGDSCSWNLLYGSKNVILGSKAGLNNVSGNRNVFLGYNAGMSETGSDKLYIDNSGTTTPLIYGDFASDYIRINGKFGTGVAPLYKIHSEDMTTTADSAAVYGKHAVSNNYGIGVKGVGGYRGVVGSAYASSGTSVIGVHGAASGSGTGNRVGIYGEASGGAINWAGYFNGNVNVTGSVTATSYIDLKIDHPLDPENKVLVHSGVSSNELMNIYNGNIVLNNSGEGTVILPEWFESLNTDFRYQLTPIGVPAVLFISREISNNSFKIAGGSSGMKVSWQVTAVRKDKYAQANPIEIEKEKDKEVKGYFINPEAYGMPVDKGIEYKINSERKTEAK